MAHMAGTLCRYKTIDPLVAPGCPIEKCLPRVSSKLTDGIIAGAIGKSRPPLQGHRRPVSENRISSTLAQGYRRLGMQGQPLISAYPQMAQVLRNRLGREHADLLARPNVDPATGTVEWWSPRPGAVRGGS